MTVDELEIEFEEPSPYPRLQYKVQQQGYLSALVCIQGGGAKGGWQGGVLDRLLGTGLVKPIATMGTSAGGINAWLTSAKLANVKEDPFDAFWGQIPRRRAKLLRMLLPSIIRGFVPCLSNAISLLFGGRRCKPCAPLLAFQAFKDVFAELLEPLLSPAGIYTYLYATDTTAARLPAVFDDQNLCTFMSAPGQMDAEHTADGRRLDRLTAIAASACLPLIQPWRDDGARYADGGLYSNLPINILLSQGSMGGDCVICVLATPLGDMKPLANYVDYRSAVLLHALREKQVPRRVVAGEATVGPAIRGTPVFLISPKRPLRSGLVRGFLSPKTMDADTMLGREAGEAFAGAVASFLKGTTQPLRAYDVGVCELPSLPRSPPVLSDFWVHWVNPQWHPHHSER